VIFQSRDHCRSRPIGMATAKSRSMVPVIDVSPNNDWSEVARALGRDPGRWAPKPIRSKVSCCRSAGNGNLSATFARQNLRTRISLLPAPQSFHLFSPAAVSLNPSCQGRDEHDGDKRIRRPCPARGPPSRPKSRSGVRQRARGSIFFEWLTDNFVFKNFIILLCIILNSIAALGYDAHMGAGPKSVPTRTSIASTDIFL